MPPPATRKEFEHNVFLVLEDVLRAIDTKDEELIQNKGWATIPHLKRIKSQPNGRLDLNTVNEMLRNQANMMEWMRYMPPPEIESKD